MTSVNKLVDRPPNSTPVINPSPMGWGKNDTLHNAWGQWFDAVHTKISPSRSQQTLTATGTVNMDCNHCNLDSSGGGYAIILDPPTAPSVELTIEMTVHTGDVTLSLTNVVGGTAATTCTWTGAAQALFLKSLNSGKWCVIKQLGVTLT